MAKDVKKKDAKVKGKESKLTPFEQELVETMKKVKGFKINSEANIVSIIYKNPDVLYNYDLKLESFSNNIWRVYFNIAQDLIVKEKKPVLDEITVGLYLEKHPKLKEKYDEYGGYETLQNAKEYVQIENFDGYYRELNKWNLIIELIKMKFPVGERLSDFADMAVEDIYNEMEARLNHVFINLEGDVKSYNLCENINELIDSLNEGANVGLPLNSSPILNNEIGGLNLGHIYMLGAGSGVGKTTTAIQWLLPSVLHHNEKLCFLVNEEDQTKIQREMIIWVANNIFKKELKKYKLRDGKFDAETMQLLRDCAKWLEEKKENRNITIIPIERYTTEIAIKIIKKYSSLGVTRFVLDTLKPSANSKTDMVWLEMQRDMVELYNCIKPTAKNVTLWVNYQLGKASTKQRYYTNESIGVSRSIVDVCSVNLMIRDVWIDELEGGKHEITGYKLEGKNKRTKIPFKLDKDKHYVAIFVTKNRFGSTQAFQVLAEHDLSTNTYIEKGICYIPIDF